jgi:hypothetical protein
MLTIEEKKIRARETQRRWTKNNPEKALLRSREGHKKNKDKEKEYRQRPEVKKRNNERTKKWSIEKKEHIKKYHREHYLKNKKHYNYQGSLYRKTPIGKFKSWKSCARVINIPFLITIDDVLNLPFKCYYSGIDLTWEPNELNTVSLDRIDNTKGYIKDNIVLTTWNINCAKNDLTKEEFLNMCKNVTRYQEVKNV